MIEVEYPDGEREAVTWLVAAMPSRWPTAVTVGVDLPTGWKVATSIPHVMVTLDGTPSAVHPVEAYQTIRVTSYAKTKTDAKRLCGRAHSALLAHPLGDGVGRVEYLTGVQPAKDPTTGAEIASATVRLTVRSQSV